jgi:hypothetical protein
MKKLYVIPLAVIAIIISGKGKVNAQSFAPALSIPVTVNGNTLVNAWAGGLNSPQFSEIDLNGDGVKDLFVFEAEGASQSYFRYSTYINNGTANQVDYHYAPQYISNFPARMHDWVLLRDYNCDGKEDIFTYNYVGGIAVYKNISTAGNLQFILEYPLLYSVYFGFPTNLFIAADELASFIDIDGDGDMDILTKGFSSGIEFHKNYSMENYGTCDSLIFSLDTSSWGGIPFTPSPSPDRACILALDNDGDGDRDLLTSLGNDFGYMHYYENTGTPQNANLILTDDSFPSYNVPAYMPNYESSFYLDVNNDNKKDLLVAAHLPNSENINNVEYYENTATTGMNNFNFVTHNFLGDNMIDAGAGANVQFFDVDQDGLQDLIIGNYNRKDVNNTYAASLSCYRNIGTAANPAFQFITGNLANTNIIGQNGLAPAFGDIDGDGDDDMLIGCSSGQLLLYINTAGPGNPANFVFPTVLLTISGTYCTPQLFDVNQDGLIDLICGNKFGKIFYYQNTGTATNPVFTLTNSFWGGINVTAPTDIFGYSYPFIHTNNASLELLVGSERGYIYRYGNISGNLNGTFTLLDTLYGGIYEPIRATVTGTDIDGDGLMDLAVGNFAGGLTIYKQLPLSTAENTSQHVSCNIFPNPVTDKLNVTLNSNDLSEIILYDITSRKLLQQTFSNAVTLNTSHLSKGIYIYEVRNNQGVIKKAKLVKE